ncbi:MULTISPECIES: hypothetical protein [Pseudomonas]|jgi:hypothetical protein|nr:MULTISPECIES: hypothetical protein [Pseudomonas]MCX9152584.1 hypothetical protein [Pseudomonas sp. TB1-B1]
MDRQRPPRLVATPLAAPSTETVATHPPVWHYGPSIPIIGGNGYAVFGFFLGLLLLLPGYGLAMLLVGMGDIHGEPPSAGSKLSESSFMLLMLGAAVFIAAMFAWVTSEPQVQAFTFDENQQLLTLTVTRRGRKPMEVRVPFDHILSIRPYAVALFDHDGHFYVTYKGPKGKVLGYQMGDGTSLADIEFHAAWLRGMIGERMQELLNLDK